VPGAGWLKCSGTGDKAGMAYEYKIIVDRCQAPELGTPRPGPRTERRHGLISWVHRAEANSKIIVESADVVALLLVEGSAKAMDRTWPKLADRVGSMIVSLEGKLDS
jgi:hypothetical protein